MHLSSSTAPSLMPPARWSGAAGVLLCVLFITMLQAAAPAFGAPPLALAAGTTRARPTTIASVVFTGSVMTPTVTVKGSGFGSGAPPANPHYTPAGHTAPGISYTCAKTTKKDGFDYGLSGLWIQDMSSTAFSAGRYDVALNELDCIGLIILRYGPTQIRFRLGAAYAQFGSQFHWALNQGDPFTLEIKGVMYSGTVSYTHT